jgi:hypothetical protein
MQHLPIAHLHSYGRREEPMKTLDLVSMLSTGVEASDRHMPGKRFAWALFTGLLGAILLLFTLFGIRSDMPQMLVTPLFWLKAAFPMAVVLPALFVTGRLSRPGSRATYGWIALSAPLLAVWLAAAFFIVIAPPDLRLGLVLGSSWRVCTLNIILLSVPTFIAMFWAVKGLAPTQLALAGAGAGLLAGAQAVLVYVLYCVEMAVPFWGVWYALGMAIPTIVGTLLGPRLLRW